MSLNGRGQKNFALGTEGKAAFESWCSENAYDEKTIFLAAWMMIQRLSHEDRKQLFQEIPDWVASGYQPHFPTRASPRKPASSA